MPSGLMNRPGAVGSQKLLAADGWAHSPKVAATWPCGENLMTRSLGVSDTKTLPWLSTPMPRGLLDSPAARSPGSFQVAVTLPSGDSFSTWKCVESVTYMLQL